MGVTWNKLLFGFVIMVRHLRDSVQNERGAEVKTRVKTKLWGMLHGGGAESFEKRSPNPFTSGKGYKVSKFCGLMYSMVTTVNYCFVM